MQLSYLDSLREKASELLIIKVEINREEDAYEIFETTNARGIDLSVADLLKNLIFKKIRSNETRDLAKDIWQEITTNIESTHTELKRFIRYFWISKYALVPEKKIYREIKNKISDWEMLLNDLWDASQRYNLLLEGNEQEFSSFRHGQRIFDAVFALRIMDVSQCYILLMTILKNYSKLGTDPVRVFELVERFTFLYSIVCKLPTNRVEKIYSNYAIKIERLCSEGNSKDVSAKIQSVFSELEKDLKEIAPSETLFKDMFMEMTLKSSDQSRWLIKYILGKLNYAFYTTQEHRVDFQNVNIEHILPQNPSPEWKITKQEIKTYVNQLGNLTIIDKVINSKAANSEISAKLAEFDKSALPINKYLIDQVKDDMNYEWGEKQIKTRQVQLADWAFRKVWIL